MGRRSAVARWLGALAVAVAGLGSARAAELPTDRGWLSAWAGVALPDTVVLGDGALDGSSLALEARGAAPLFGVGAWYRFSRVDLGMLFEGWGSARFDDDGVDARLGDAFRAAVQLRWRFGGGGWGAFFARLTPAIAVLGHSDALRRRAATLAGPNDATEEVDLAEASATDAEPSSLGFSLGIGFGVQLALTDGLALTAQLDLATQLADIGTRDGDVALKSLRSAVSLGLEWAL